MMALSPEERTAVLALNPQARPQDLDRFEALLVERLEAAEVDPARAQALDRELKEMEARLFPRLQEALQQVWARQPEEPEEPGEPGVA